MVQNEKGEIILDRSEFGLLIENDDTAAYDPDPSSWPEWQRKMYEKLSKEIRAERPDLFKATA